MASARRLAASGGPRNVRGSRSVRARLGVAVGLTIVGAGCTMGVAPEAPADDPVLVQGRDVYIANCMSCHGSAGGGGRGAKLNEGRVVENYPDPADQVAVITGGRKGMPSFDGRLTPEQIEAAVRYTREVLAG